jgi:tripartite-type tricarboxylate transporter receptor subunit TctC
MKKILFALLFAMTSAWSSTSVIVIPNPPGGPPDAWGRVVAQHLTQTLNEEYIVSNRPGADGRIAIDHVAMQPANGKTLIVATTGSFLFSRVFYSKHQHDFNNFDLLVPVVRAPVVMAVSNNLNVSSWTEFLALARTRSLNCAGSSSSSVFVAKQIFDHVGVNNINFIPFRGSADMGIALSSGIIDCGFDTNYPAINFHSSGKYRIIAVGTNNRYQEVPNATLFKDIVPGLTFYNWYGLGVLKGTPLEEQNKIFNAVKKLNQSTDYQDKMQRAGLEIVANPQGTNWVQQEYTKFETLRQRLKIEKLD